MSWEQRLAVRDLLQYIFDTMFDPLDNETDRERLVDVVSSQSS